MTEVETDPTVSSRRLLALERQNRRLTGLVVLLILMAMVQTVWHLLPGPKMVSAERFVLKRRGFPPQGEFSLWTDGTPALRINNEKGEARALWAMRRDGTLNLKLNDAHHQARIELMVDPEGLPRILVYGNDGRSRGVLQVDADNRAELIYPQR